MVEVAVAAALLDVAELEVLEITVEEAVDEIVLELALVDEVIVDGMLVVLAYGNPLFVSVKWRYFHNIAYRDALAEPVVPVRACPPCYTDSRTCPGVATA